MGELFGIGLYLKATIGKEEGALLTQIAVGYYHDEE
ncbi:hypothetical protein SDC9_190808 [bioreactor metagenome]|uniref:Uncharacterized protein n=1 Tax=bioreactor metagenome TaxID=1076179 RepID=A0A645HYI6_9ZZZZ